MSVGMGVGMLAKQSACGCILAAACRPPLFASPVYQHALVIMHDCCRRQQPDP
jgi:hypothetical protein